MFISHVNAVISICAYLQKNFVCYHVNFFYAKLTIKGRLFRENKMSELKKSHLTVSYFFSVSGVKFIENICEWVKCGINVFFSIMQQTVWRSNEKQNSYEHFLERTTIAFAFRRVRDSSLVESAQSESCLLPRINSRNNHKHNQEQWIWM